MPDGDVPADADDADDCPVRGAKRGFQGVQQGPAAVGIVNPFFVAPGCAGHEHLPVHVPAKLSRLPGQKIKVGAPDDFGGRLPHISFKGPVAVKIDAVLVLNEDEVGDGIDDAPQQRLLPGQGRFCLPAGRNFTFQLAVLVIDGFLPFAAFTEPGFKEEVAGGEFPDRAQASQHHQ